METTIVTNRDLPVYRPAAVVAGCDYRDPLHLQSLTGVATTAADLDVTGATWALVVASEQGGASLLAGGTITAWDDSGVLVETAAEGYVHLVICADDTDTLGAGEYYYQLTLTLPAGSTVLPSWTQCVLHGTLTINDAAAAAAS